MLSIVLVTVLNIIIYKDSKHHNKNIRIQHYIVGYFFIVYLMLTLDVVGFPSLFEWKRMLRLNQSIYNPHLNLIPFKDGIEISDILNIILFMPFGFLLPMQWEKHRNFWSTFYNGLFLSLIIEIGQMFVRYRVTDINDLIMNTIGAIVGWIIFNVIKSVFHRFSTNTAIKVSSSDSLAIKSESWMYVVIAIICAFFR